VRICAAQLAPRAGNIEENIEQHLALIDAAVQEHMDVIFFPELSLTGYEPTLSKELALDVTDERLHVFQKLCDEKGIIIGVGVPIKTDTLPHISLLIFQKRMPIIAYHKYLLHEDELPFFSAGPAPVMLDVKDEKLMLTICYEALQPSQMDFAINNNASIYVASVAKTQKNIEVAVPCLSDLARDSKMFVVMSNCTGLCDNFEAAGQSTAFLKGTGKSVNLGMKSVGIIGVDTKKQSLVKRIIPC